MSAYCCDLYWWKQHLHSKSTEEDVEDEVSGGRPEYTVGVHALPAYTDGYQLRIERIPGLGLLVHGVTVYLAFVPENCGRLPSALDFDTEKIRWLFQLGYKKAITHNAWLERKPPKDLNEFRQPLEFYENIS